MNTVIPNGSDPGPALDKMMSHFVQLKGMSWEIPEKIQAMMILAKAPQSMEAIVQVFTQISKDAKSSEEQKKELAPAKIISSMRMSWETNQRAGNTGRNNQQQAHKLSAVKPAASP